MKNRKEFIKVITLCRFMFQKDYSTNARAHQFIIKNLEKYQKFFMGLDDDEIYDLKQLYYEMEDPDTACAYTIEEYLVNFPLMEYRKK